MGRPDGDDERRRYFRIPAWGPWLQIEATATGTLSGGAVERVEVADRELDAQREYALVVTVRGGHRRSVAP